LCIREISAQVWEKKIQKLRLSVRNFAKKIVKTPIFFFNTELYENEGVQILSN